MELLVVFSVWHSLLWLAFIPSAVLLGDLVNHIDSSESFTVAQGVRGYARHEKY